MASPRASAPFAGATVSPSNSAILSRYLRTQSFCSSLRSLAAAFSASRFFMVGACFLSFLAMCSLLTVGYRLPVYPLRARPAGVGCYV